MPENRIYTYLKKLIGFIIYQNCRLNLIDEAIVNFLTNKRKKIGEKFLKRKSARKKRELKHMRANDKIRREFRWFVKNIPDESLLDLAGGGRFEK